MDRIVFAERWREIFAASGFKSFSDFFLYSSGEIINPKGKRNVQTLKLTDNGLSRVVYIKRFNYPHLKDMISSFKSFGRCLSQAAIEWENANFLLKRNIGTYKPLCFGEKIICGLERKSFFVSEKLDGLCLSDFVRENWNRMSRQEKEAVMADLGKFVRKIHDAQVNFPDMYIWHIFISPGKQRTEHRFSIIDLHRMEFNVTNRKKQVSNLGRFEYSLLDEYFNDSLRRLFVRSYAADVPGEDAERLYEKIKKYCRKLLSKRKQKPY